MRKTKQEEHADLQKRTDQLKEEHAALDRTRTPFDQAAHNRHSAKLKKHKADLVRHRKRRQDR